MGMYDKEIAAHQRNGKFVLLGIAGILLFFGVSSRLFSPELPPCHEVATRIVRSMNVSDPYLDRDRYYARAYSRARQYGACD